MPTKVQNDKPKPKVQINSIPEQIKARGLTFYFDLSHKEKLKLALYYAQNLK